MKYKRHVTDLSSVIGVCISCLRERLFILIAPRMNIKQDENWIKVNEDKLSKVLDVYEKRLGESRYVVGDEFTLADLFHPPNTQLLGDRTDRGELFTSRKNVGRWWSKICSRESWKKVVEMQKSPPPKSS